MGNITALGTAHRALPQLGITKYVFETDAAADSGDTVVITLGSIGVGTFLGINEYYHAVANSIVKPAAPSHTSTTVVSGGVLTITLGTATNIKHVFEIIGTAK